MTKETSSLLFNSIAPVYGLFYNVQKKRFTEVIEGVENELDLSSFKTIIDIGCGTGALCSVLNGKGLSVTGIDPANKMLEIARNKQKNKEINFIQADVLEGLPFEDNSFDIAIASYVAHGLKTEERKRMYVEMSRVTEEWVVIYDYNDKRSLLITIIEWLEGGDYFHFIRNAEPEMRDCVSEMKSCFSEVKVINVDTRAAWYICKPFV
ncbi:MAG: class I SAM-dependent methyltransferase [Bacillota bacterium]|nr:class I SAM-dependent methyltransferase [Bacillota bacterium]MDW7730608.1 class I SAM-dependent methyltransferase [Bacillota bacterium]